MNPVHFGLEMLFRSVGMEMVKLETSEEFYRLHGFCARTDSKQVNLETKFGSKIFLHQIFHN